MQDILVPNFRRYFYFNSKPQCQNGRDWSQSDVDFVHENGSAIIQLSIEGALHILAY